ncbi:apolipoprotein N-acyltransferase [Vitiosangium sp. GDMCC 1.1324]|uniref:apolipoprotein N-acyltransferase n=1 Tax=Vitiosangium sp. (strain GDMCC 1.1324) TaxID=2138576 RepID=UPI000D34142F|nr:apolipoprotein N-acyltransferase [Vitiosangium sp. GDMCC 1.1324]PTL85442.1 apolipoprotein N-acyltransferase [Vitiosangium sp. GDMCC 1.1324]
MSPVAARSRRLAALLLGVAGTTGLVWLFGSLEARWVALCWVSLVPWLLVLDQVGSRREAFIAGVALALAFTAAIFGWFPEALRSYSQAPLALCWLALLALAPFMELQFITFALVRYHMRRTTPEGPLAFWRVTLTSALVYVGTEWLCPKLFAETLGQGLYASELMRQGADIAGAHGLTLVLLIANECVLAAGKALAAHGLRVGSRRALAPLAVLTALVLGGLGYGQLRYQQVAGHKAQEPDLVVGVVQANITKYEKLAAEMGTYDVVRMILDTHYRLSDELLQNRKLDLLIWPETVYPTTFGTPKSEAGAEFDAEISGFVSRSRVPLLFGTYDLEQEREYNAAMFLGPGRDGTLARSAYRKTMLFPLTEWVPEVLDSPWLRERMSWTGYWKRGPGPQTLALQLREGRALTVAPLICYESIFPSYVAEEARRGAELIVTLSNDSWFSGTPAPRLHLMHAAFRSIETRLPQVRVTNSGISALISPTGEVLTEVPDDHRASVAVTVPPAPHLSTLMVAWGDWLGPTALALSAVSLLGPSLLARRKARPDAKS